jgi:cytoskeletal protein CcmA (bactofilin family)
MSFFGSRRQAEPETSTITQKQPELPQPAMAPQTSVGFETVLGAGSAIEGTLRSSSNIRLDGTFSGTLEITGNVLVGETAKINADINAKNISIAGAVRGNISGKKVQLLRTGRVWGDIRAAALTTEEGAFIDGKITMVPNEKDTPKPPAHPTTTDTQTAAPVGIAQPPSYNRQVEGVTPIGMGATEEDPDDMIHEGNEAPSGYADNPLIENISQGDDLPAQTDAGDEGQASVDPTDPEADETDETRQST